MLKQALPKEWGRILPADEQWQQDWRSDVMRRRAISPRKIIKHGRTDGGGSVTSSLLELLIAAKKCFYIPMECQMNMAFFKF